MTQEELAQVEAQMDEAKLAIKQGEAFKRLLQNEDYQLMISEGYVKDYAKELGEAIAGNTGQYDEARLISNLKGINGFVEYGFKVATNHTAALETVAGLENYIAEQASEDEE
jgi:hypothetical protein